MATTKIADVVVPEVFSPYVAEMDTTKNALITSGAIVVDPRLSNLVAGGGTSIQIPFWNNLTRNDSKVGSDDPAVLIAALKRQAKKMIGVRCFRTEAFENADIAGLLAGADPNQGIAEMIAGYWRYNFQRILTAQLTGVFADNIANDGGDMVYDIYSDVIAGSITDAERISLDAIIETCHTSGDSEDVYAGMIMHSKVAKQLQKLEGNDFIPKSQTNTGFAEYAGKLVLIDDDMTVTTGTNSPSYDTIFFGAGAIGAGFNSANNYTPEAIDREEKGGNGAGIEALITRRDFVFHPYGFQFSGSVAGATPTNAELSTAAAWDRVFDDRKNIKLAMLRSNA